MSREAAALSVPMTPRNRPRIRWDLILPSLATILLLACCGSLVVGLLS